MDDGLDNKFRLATIAPLDRRMKRKHLAVYGFLLDWYHRKYGDVLASVRHIVAQLKERDPAGIGLYTGDVHSALKDLEAWGYITANVGSGRQASRYVPVWVHGSSVHKTPNTTSETHSVRETPNTSVRENQNTTADSVRESENEDPITGPGLQTGVRVSGKFEDAATPPPSPGLAAVEAVPPSGDGFDEFWKAWPRKHGLRKARTEWAKIKADVDIIIEVATDWAAHYRKHATDMKWVPEPANWLRDERWREDLPLIHIDAKGAAIAKAKANAPLQPAEPQEPTDLVYRHVVIEDVEPLRGGGYEISFAFKDSEPGDDTSTRQRYDNETTIGLLKAVGINNYIDEMKAVGRPCFLVADEEGNHTFEPIFRSDANSEISYDPLPTKSRHPSPRMAPWRTAA